MCVCSQDGVGVQFVQYDLVARVLQVFYGLLQSFADMADGLIVARVEEYLDWVGPVAQFVFLCVLVDVSGNLS